MISLAKLKKSISCRLRGVVNIEALKKKGLRIGTNTKILPGCTMDPSHCWLITIGNNVTLSERVHILAHDASTEKHLHYTKIGLVSVGDNTFIGADTIVLPNVTIGNNCVIGAGSIVSKNVPDNTIFAGNPAKFICKTDEYTAKHEELMKNATLFDESFTIRKNITNEQKAQMIEALKKGMGYVK